MQSHPLLGIGVGWDGGGGMKLMGGPAKSLFVHKMFSRMHMEGDRPGGVCSGLVTACAIIWGFKKSKL